MSEEWGGKKKHGVLLVYYLGDGFMHAKPQIYIYIYVLYVCRSLLPKTNSIVC